ncbi:MAG: Selenocysteine-specific elongation factor [Planctomycetes bacterium ADurb.Bin126]|nr:MAG: Selenocysteine-specific elongation factor [Planctomycetes bacterium ADurb.Bin126]HOD81081.1 selenocysteine-specific translation elongation factor [Phycisphaerae bacterium]HQL73661.1 selenocysteine-specific translation elongation factor [Phycisphaerae bacterium]
MNRRNIMLGTAGHVDHGKTALVKILTGCDTDRLPEEKKRGLTIEAGYAPCRMRDERIVGIVDVPGHVAFIRNMVAGAHGIDVVILVVAADDSVMPQTREHLDILTLMGVRRGVIAMTKIDLVDAEMRELAAQDIRRFVQGTFLADAPLCGVSSITGEGYDAFLGELNRVADSCDDRTTTGSFRLWVEKSFPIRGFGTVVSGIPSGGEVRVGDRLHVLPGRQAGRVRNLEVYGEQADLARAGECTAMNLVDVDSDLLHRGKLLSGGGDIPCAAMFEADLTLLPHLPHELKDYAEVHLHMGTAETMAKVAMLEGRPLGPGGRQVVQFRLNEPLPAPAGERFVIRAAMGDWAGGTVTTLGGGRVLGASDQRLKRGREWTIAMLTRRRECLDRPADWTALMLAEAAGAISQAELARRAQLALRQVEPLVSELLRLGVALDVPAPAGGELLVHRDVVASAREAIEQVLEGFYQANPSRVGMEQAELAAQVECPRDVFEFTVERLIAAGTAERQGTVVALVGRGAKLSSEDARLCRQIEETLERAHLEPPLPADLAGQLGLGEAKLLELCRILIDQGRVLRLDAKVIMHAKAVAAAREVVIALFRKAGAFTTVEFRDAIAISRKYAVPLLDYFDTARVTVRNGNRRTPGVLIRDLLKGS